jgi:hypothetical protein
MALIAVGCKRPIDRDKLKTVFVDGCETSFRKQAPQLQDVDVEVLDYCNCSAEKVLQDLSDDELRYFDTHVAEMQSPEMQARLERVSQPCLDEFTRKIEAKIAP